MNHATATTASSLSKKIWIYRFADRMVEASDYDMCLGEAVRLGRAEFERWHASSPEATVRRLLSGCQQDCQVLALRELAAFMLRGSVGAPARVAR